MVRSTEVLRLRQESDEVQEVFVDPREQNVSTNSRTLLSNVMFPCDAPSWVRMTAFITLMTKPNALQAEESWSIIPCSFGSLCATIAASSANRRSRRVVIGVLVFALRRDRLKSAVC